MNQRLAESVKRLDALFSAAFRANHTAMHDWVQVRFALKDEREWWRGFRLGVLVATTVILAFIAGFAHGAIKKKKPAGPPPFVHSEGRTPWTLRDCPPETTIVINHSNGERQPWQRFCRLK